MAALTLTALFTAGAPAATAAAASPGSTQIVRVSGSWTYDQGEGIYGPDNGGAWADSWGSCWTSFSPPNPGGLGMEHYYENCASYANGYCPAGRINNTGPLYVFWDDPTRGHPILVTAARLWTRCSALTLSVTGSPRRRT